MTRCKLQAKKCKFWDNTDIEERLIEQLIIGARHRKVQEKLLRKDGDLKLDDALDITGTCEATMVHMEQLLGEKTVSAISRKPQQNKTGPIKEKFCKRCGLTHSKYLCEHVQHGVVLAMSVEKRTIRGKCATQPKIRSQETDRRQAPGENQRSHF